MRYYPGHGVGHLYSHTQTDKSDGLHNHTDQQPVEGDEIEETDILGSQGSHDSDDEPSVSDDDCSNASGGSVHSIGSDEEFFTMHEMYENFAE
jgi:hypothetical protein